MKSIYKRALATSIISLLAACGGGGGGTTTAANPAEGLWQGSSSTGAFVTMVILENGEAWGGASIGNTLISAISGTSTGSGSIFNASGSEFYFSNNTVATGSYTGTVFQKSRIQATGSTGGTVNLSYNSYYEQPVTAADLAGSYSLNGRTARYLVPSLRLTVGNDGRFTLIDNGCTTTGVVSPRSPTTSVANISFTGSGSCALGNGATASGIVLLDKTVTPKTFYMITLTTSKNDGMVLIGTKLN